MTTETKETTMTTKEQLNALVSWFDSDDCLKAGDDVSITVRPLVPGPLSTVEGDEQDEILDDGITETVTLTKYIDAAGNDEAVMELVARAATQYADTVSEPFALDIIVNHPVAGMDRWTVQRIDAFDVEDLKS